MKPEQAGCFSAALCSVGVWVWERIWEIPEKAHTKSIMCQILVGFPGRIHLSILVLLMKARKRQNCKNYWKDKEVDLSLVLVFLQWGEENLQQTTTDETWKTLNSTLYYSTWVCQSKNPCCSPHSSLLDFEEHPGLPSPRCQILHLGHGDSECTHKWDAGK